MKAFLILLGFVTLTAQAGVKRVPRTIDLQSRLAIKGHFEKRFLVFEIETSNFGPLYSVRTRAGKSLVFRYNADRMRAEYPTLLEFIDAATMNVPPSWKGQ